MALPAALRSPRCFVAGAKSGFQSRTPAPPAATAAAREVSAGRSWPSPTRGCRWETLRPSRIGCYAPPVRASPFICALLSVGASTARAEPLVIRASVPERLLVLRFSPSSAPPRRPIAAVLDAAESALSARAQLRVTSAERSGIGAAELDACPLESRFRCWVGLGSRDPLVRYLLILSVQPLDEETATWTPILFDLRLGRAIGVRQDLSPERAERELYESAIRLEARRVSESEPIEQHFAAIFDALRATFESSAHAGAFGAVEVRPVELAYRLSLDGRALSPVPAGASARIEEVPPGAHALQAWTDYGRSVVAFEVAPGGTADIALAFGSEDLPRHPARAVAEEGGLGLIVAGATLALVGRLAEDRPPVEVSASVGEPPFAPRGPSVPFTLGMGLMAGGAFSASSSLLLGNEAEAPWWELGMGIALGAGTFGLLYALDAR